MSAYVKQIFKKNDGAGGGGEANPYREDVLHICIKFRCDGFQVLNKCTFILLYLKLFCAFSAYSASQYD